MKNLFAGLILLYAVQSHADIRLYGDIGGGLEVSQTRKGSQRATQTQIRDLDSRIGLEGRHALGGQNNMVWHVGQDGRAGSRNSGTVWQRPYGGRAAGPVEMREGQYRQPD